MTTNILFLGANAIAQAIERDLKPIALSDVQEEVLRPQRLALEVEAQQIKETIRRNSDSGQFNVETEWAVSATALREAILRHKPHIVHVSGHGIKSGELLLIEEGILKPMPQKGLLDLIKALEETISLVVLNACYTASTAESLAEIVGCAVGMQGPIDDRLAVEFAEAFYSAIAFNQSYRKAFEVGNSGITSMSVSGQGKPIFACDPESAGERCAIELSQEHSPMLQVNDPDRNFSVAHTDTTPLPSKITTDDSVEKIRDHIVRDPLVGAKALAELLKTKCECREQLQAVLLKTAELERIERETRLFGPTENNKAERNRVIYFLLGACTAALHVPNPDIQ